MKRLDVDLINFAHATFSMAAVMCLFGNNTSYKATVAEINTYKNGVVISIKEVRKMVKWLSTFTGVEICTEYKGNYKITPKGRVLIKTLMAVTVMFDTPTPKEIKA